MIPCFVKVGRFLTVKCTIGAVEGDQKHGSQVTEFHNSQNKNETAFFRFILQEQYLTIRKNQIQ